MKKFVLYVNAEKDPDYAVTERVKQAILSFGGTFTSEAREADAMIVLGGDGTLLRGVHKFPDLPVLGINLGTLGFLTEFDAEDFSYLKKVIDGEYTIENRMMLEGRISEGEPFYALNDIVLSRGGSARIMPMKLFVDGSPAENYRADGIIVSTPTGSTAYSLSAGGPVVEPDMELMCVTPICPHSMHSRTIIISPKRSIRIILGEKEGAYLHVSADGTGISEISGGVTVDIRCADRYARFIRLENHSFYDILNKKQELR